MPITDVLAAVRAVQTFKTLMERMSEGNVENEAYRFLLKYRVTPHCAMGVPLTIFETVAYHIILVTAKYWTQC